MIFLPWCLNHQHGQYSLPVLLVLLVLPVLPVVLVLRR
jgi:hypothetical protein